MALQVKICGLTEPDRVVQAAELGAAFLGFVFYPPSPRYLDPARARELVSAMPAGPEAVGLLVVQPRGAAGGHQEQEGRYGQRAREGATGSWQV